MSALRRPEVFDGFQLESIDTGEATLRVRYSGSGLPLLAPWTFFAE